MKIAFIVLVILAFVSVIVSFVVPAASMKWPVLAAGVCIVGTLIVGGIGKARGEL